MPNTSDFISVTSQSLTVDRISSAKTNLSPGTYDLDSSGGPFSVTLADTVGEWNFVSSNRSIGTNAVTIGSASESYTDATGSQVTGPFILNANGQTVTMLHTEVGSDYRVLVDDAVVATTTFTPNGAWDANTNTPNMSLAVNRVDGTTHYVYHVDVEGTQDLGDGATLFSVGGRLEWFSPTVYSYIPPGSGSIAVVDDDTFASATSTNVPSAESTKAYVDSKSSLNPALGRVQYGNGARITGEDTLFYDNVNNRLGINTTSPSQALDVVGNIENSALVGTGTRQVRATAAGVLTTSTSGAVARAIVAAFKTSAATISSGSPFVVGFNIESIDNGANFVPASGTFTVPRTGLYRISGSIAFTSASWPVGTEARLGVSVGTTNTTYGYVDSQTTSSLNVVVTMDTILSLTAGDSVVMTIFQDSGSDKIISTSSGRTNKILIEELDSFTN